MYNRTHLSRSLLKINQTISTTTNKIQIARNNIQSNLKNKQLDDAAIITRKGYSNKGVTQYINANIISVLSGLSFDLSTNCYYNGK